jgi:hypothetical protein
VAKPGFIVPETLMIEFRVIRFQAVAVPASLRQRGIAMLEARCA